MAANTLTHSWYDLEDQQYRELLDRAMEAVRLGEIIDWNKLIQLARVIEQAMYYEFVPWTQEIAKSIYDDGLEKQAAETRFELHETWNAQHEIMLIEGDGEFVHWVRDKIIRINAVLDEESRRARIRLAFDSIDGDAIEFLRIVTGRDVEGIRDKPIADYVSATEFAEKVLTTTNRSKSQLRAAINDRYSDNLDMQRLAADEGWLTQVESNLQKWVNDNTELKSPSHTLIMQLRDTIHLSKQRLARVTKRHKASSLETEDEGRP